VSDQLTELDDQPSSGVAIGVYRPELPDDLSRLNAYEAALRRPVPIVHWFALWGGWKSTFNTADLEAVSAHGSLPLITWEPWTGITSDPAWSLNNAILSGTHDAYVRSWALGLAAYGRPVLLRFAHEMHNQPAYPWATGINGNRPEDYVAAWRHVRAIFREAGARNVRWVWNPNTVGSAPGTDYTAIYQALYPGDDQVDLVGLDIYNTGAQLDWGAPRWRTFSEALSDPYAAVTAMTRKPIILPEVGSTEIGGAKGQWISDMFDQELEQFPRVRALVWFDVDKEQTWSLRSSQSSYQAWLAGSARSQTTLGPS
jgi:beta-mannanase